MTYQSRFEESEHFLQMREVEGEPNSATLIEIEQVQECWAQYKL